MLTNPKHGNIQFIKDILSDFKNHDGTEVSPPK